MLKTKLYWRVLANFAFLLIILTAMTLLTLYLLAEIEKNFGSTSNEIRTLTNVESVRHVLADAPDDANLYLITGNESAKASYENAIKEFDDAISSAVNNVSDSLLTSPFAAVKVIPRHGL